MKNIAISLAVLAALLLTAAPPANAIDGGDTDIQCTGNDPGYLLACALSWAFDGCICAELQHCGYSGYPESCPAYNPDAIGNQGRPCEYDNTCSPVVINLDRGNFRFTSLEDGVVFDIDNDGSLESTAWTDPGQNIGLLALDYSGNGLIDSGYELFGSVSPQWVREDGTTDGYNAMATLDSVHGNGDGWLTPEDSLWPELRLWIDANHDGISQAGELHALAAVGITGIDLDPVVSNRRDRHGNILRWTSKAVLDGQVRPIAADVLFRIED